VKEQRSQGITPEEALGRFLGHVSGWLARLPELFQAMSRPYAITALALEALLIKRGFIDPAELAAAKEQASANLLIEQTVGAVGQAVEAHWATFRPGAIAALTPPGPPAAVAPDAVQALRRVFDLATIEEARPLALRIGDQEYPVRHPLALSLAEAEALKRLEAAEEGKPPLERMALRAQQLRILVPSLSEDAVKKLTGLEIMQALGFIWENV
jgi:hypothetical protein